MVDERAAPAVRNTPSRLGSEVSRVSIQEQGRCSAAESRPRALQPAGARAYWSSTALVPKSNQVKPTQTQVNLLLGCCGSRTCKDASVIETGRAIIVRLRTTAHLNDP